MHGEPERPALRRFVAARDRPAAVPPQAIRCRPELRLGLVLAPMIAVSRRPTMIMAPENKVE
jgi:hypothetical protein